MNILMERVHWIRFVTDRFWHENHVPMLIVCICLCFSTCHVIILYYSISRRAFSAKIPSILTMHPLSTAAQYEILSLLDAGHSARLISVSTGYSYATISRLHSKHCSHLSKSSGGRPSKLSTANIHFAQHLISSGKADTAVDATKALCTITNQSLNPQTVCRGLKAAGMKPVVKKKRPLLSKRHRKERMDFALAHQDWTVEDWKKVVWSDETKINRLGSDGRKWVWKRWGRA